MELRLLVLFCLLMFITSYYSVQSLTCLACQGTPNTPCDLDPEGIITTVPCNGTCLTRRTLFATGRAMRTIWRGCDTTIFPLILTEASRDSCTEGNFFVECTSTCRENLCNKLTNGIPWCWNCDGYPMPCPDTPMSGAHDCAHKDITTTPKEEKELACVLCNGKVGSDCEAAPFKVTTSVACRGNCIVRRSLDRKTRKLENIWRGCMNSLFPGVLRTDALNSCDDEAFGDLVECTQTCDHNDYCNKYLSGLTDCWDKEGRLKDKCNTRAVPDAEKINTFGNNTTPDPIKQRSDMFKYRRLWRSRSTASISGYSAAILFISYIAHSLLLN